MLMASTATLLGQVFKKISDLGREPSSDRDLLCQFVHYRSEGAFEELVRRHGPLVWGVCQRMLSHQADAEDAFQSVWMVLARKARSIHRTDRLPQWLYGVARHAALNVRKIKQRRARREQPWGESTDVADPVHYVWNDLSPIVDDELSRLPAKYFLPVMLCCLQGKSHQEAADLLSWPIGTVAGRLSRGREMLRQRLLQRGVVVSPAVLAVVLSREVMAGVLPETLLTSTLSSVFASSTVGLAGSTLSPVVIQTMQGTLRDMILARFMSWGIVAVGLMAVGSAAGWCWQKLTVGSPTVAVHSTVEAIQSAVVHPRTVQLPSDPQAVILRWKQVDTQGERPDTELVVQANGKVTGSYYHAALGSVIPLEAKLNEKEIQQIMQYAVHDLQGLQIDVKATWKQLQQEFQFNGDQRSPSDTLMTDLEIQTADRTHQFSWFQLASSEAWFHEVPAVRQAAALQRRMNNLLLVAQAGGADQVEPVAQSATAWLRLTYPQLAPFDSTHLTHYSINPENGVCTWMFSHGSKFGNPNYFSATFEQSTDGTLRSMLIVPQAPTIVPTMKRRATANTN